VLLNSESRGLDNLLDGSIVCVAVADEQDGGASHLEYDNDDRRRRQRATHVSVDPPSQLNHRGSKIVTRLLFRLSKLSETLTRAKL